MTNSGNISYLGWQWGKTDTNRRSTYVGKETGSNWRAHIGPQTLVEVENGCGSNARITIFWKCKEVKCLGQT